MSEPRLRRRGLAGLLLALALLAAGLALTFSAYRRVSAPLHLTAAAVPVQGVVTEKFVEARPDRLLPFDVPTYVVRYAYPNPAGQMRTGEQVLTKKTYEALPTQGGQAFVVIEPDAPGLSVLNPRFALPAGAGWRAGLGAAAVVGAVVCFAVSIVLPQRARAAG